jgi:hypothetical protein
MIVARPSASVTTNGTRSVRTTATMWQLSCASTGAALCASGPTPASENVTATSASPPASAKLNGRNSGAKRGRRRGVNSRRSSSLTHSGSGAGRLARRIASIAASGCSGPKVGTVLHYARAGRNPTLALILAVAGLLAAAPQARSAPMQVGFYDPVFASADPVERATWLDRARSAGAEVVRVNLIWALVAPAAPADPTDPADPVYRWATFDAAVADANARGLRVLLTVTGAPPWAEQGPRPETAAIGSWQPDPVALGAFAQAAARHYTGSVHAWQIWNEPNLSLYLAPQWKSGRPFAPVRYRSLLNAAYRAIKAVDPSNLVVTAGTAPYGDPLPGGSRIMPARFWREVLCVSGTRLRARRCPSPARFDALAHHPYGIRGPTSHARNADDVALPDLGRLTRIVRAAVRHRTVFPARAKQLWVTEVSWDSSPPDPDGVPAERFAPWVSEALSVLERQGTDVVTWFRIRDQAPVPSYAATNQSGLYLLSGEPKPALDAWVAGVNRIRAGHRRKRSAVRSSCSTALKTPCPTANVSTEGAP